MNPSSGRRLLVVLGVIVVLALGYVVWDASRAELDADDPEAGDASRRLTAEGETVGLEGRGEKGKAVQPTSDPTGMILPSPVDLEAIDRLRDLHGVVVRADGAPVAGAVVEVVQHPWRRGSLLAHDEWHTETTGPATLSARDGTFALPLTRGITVALRVSAEGFATITLEERQPGERVRVVLRRGVTLVLTARDPEGNAVPGVQVTLGGRGAEQGTGFRARGVCDAEGGCRFEELPARGRVRIEARAGPLGGWADRWETVELPAEGEHGYDFTVSPGRVVRGRVTDAATGRPVEGARVGMGWTFFKEVRTDADGRYALGGWTGNGYHEIHVLAAGYARAERAVTAAATFDVTLKRGFALRGQVLGSRGAVGGAQVAVVGSHSGESGQLVSTGHTRTRADGSFAVADLRRDVAHILVVMAPGHGRLVQTVAAPEQGAAILDLGAVTLPPGLRIAGRVLDADGKAMPRTSVTITGPLGLQGDGSNYGREEERVTDDLGRYTFGDLASGRYVVTAGAYNGVQSTRELQLEADREAFDLRFEPQRTLTVRVVNARDEPVPEVTVYAAPWGAEDAFSVTNAKGTVTFRLPLHVRWVQLRVFGNEGGKPYLQPDEQRVAADAGQHRIVLQDAAVLSGRLLDPTGAPIIMAQVGARRGDALVGSGHTDAQGRFRLLLKPGGPVDVAFRGDVWRDAVSGGRYHGRLPLVASVPRTPVPGKGIVLRAAAIPAESELRVRVLLPDGKPAQGFRVVLTPTPVGTEGRSTTDAEGRVRYAKLTTQPVTLDVGPPRARHHELAAQRETNVLPGGDEIVIRLAAPVLLEGVAVDAAGAPIEGASVMCNLSLSGSLPAVKTAADGRFTLALPPAFADRVEIWGAHKTADGTFLYASVSGVDPRAGPLRLVLKPHRGW
ncbi:MAG: carboxypeptidase regulatory-like domain-containing protein [Planctomycetota bacterium]|nr:carboxypeptidase regulatory-like domain-containing protein [Planctomycetota bacterium]